MIKPLGILHCPSQVPSGKSFMDEEGCGAINEDAEALLLPSSSKYFHHITRELARESHHLYNRVCSILRDAQFVECVTQHYAGLPVLANLRCGCWYVRYPQDSCYFKSTDGHHGNWSFSLVRLNLNVLHHVAESGGCIIVDATRKGKKFPVTFLESIVGLWQLAPSTDALLPQDAMNKTIPIWIAVMNRAIARVHGCGPSWDASLHTPIWVSESERNQIESRIDSWVEAFSSLGENWKQTLPELDRPLRPLWICPTSTFTEHSQDESAPVDFFPVVMVSCSSGDQAGARRSSGSQVGRGWPYVYVPGAGDDEESWACSLTPEKLWNYCDDLVASGPHGIEAAVDRFHDAGVGIEPCKSKAKMSSDVATDVHHKRPGGSDAPYPLCNKDTICWIEETRIALGALSAINSTDVWSHADAILNCGASPSPLECTSECYLWLPVKNSKQDRSALKKCLPLALKFLSNHLQEGRSVLVQDEDGMDAGVCIVVALLLGCFTFIPSPDKDPQASFSGVFTNCQEKQHTKADVRKCLCFVTTWYSHGRPTRGMLKQVFNFFLELKQNGP